MPGNHQPALRDSLSPRATPSPRDKFDIADLPSEIEAIATLVADCQDDLVGLIQNVQHRYGFLPRNVLREVARQLKVPLARLFGIATFYGAFHLQPRGRNIVKVCSGTACHVSGAPHITEVLANHLGIESGETTEDMVFTLERVACVGCCSLAPVLVIGGDTHGRVSRQDAVDVVSALAADSAGVQ